MVIIVTNNFLPSRGGIQTLISRIADEIVGDGTAVTVVAPNYPGSREFDASAKYRVVRYRQLPRPLEVLSMLRAYLRARSASNGTFLTVASAWWPSCFAVVAVPARIRGPLVVFAHGTEVGQSRNVLRNFLMKRTLAEADAVLANSQFTANLLHAAGFASNVKLTPPGFDVSPIAPNRAEDPTVLSVGRLIERKGFDRVLAALPDLIAKFPSLTYEIVGEGPQASDLREYARKLGVSERVRFLGSVSADELTAAYARAWCFALPVRSVGLDVEGFGIVYLEAAMARLPTVGGRGSGAADAIEDGETGVLVDGNNVSEIRDALSALLSDRAMAEEMGQRGFMRASSFTWQRMKDEVLSYVPI
jgi:phosphatidylinositol alpha-1,6-mannosyltransferase